MLDKSARRLIESAELPRPLTGEQARDFISRAYLRWIATYGLGAEAEEDDIASLSRLSLASSLLSLLEEKTAATSFLVAESADVARILKTGEEGLPEAARFRRAIHYLDLASFFHLSDYDANAGVVASEALKLLHSVNEQPGITTQAHLSYYRSLAFFLTGKFGSCRSESSHSVDAYTTEERAFLFLRSYLAHLTDLYVSPEHPGIKIEEKLISLSNILETAEHSLYALTAEVNRLLQFGSVVENKSLYRRLIEVLPGEEDYLRARISSYNDQGYPFAWPSSRLLCEKYLSGASQHAVLTFPTGAGKGFLAELAIAQALSKGWVLYLAPTNALCAQIRDDLRENLQTVTRSEVDAFLGKTEYTSELPRYQLQRQIVAVTPEKALLLLKREPERFKHCSLVVMDECQILGSGNRGDIAEIVLAFAIAQNPEVRVIMMSALISDGDKLASWLEKRSGKKAVHLSSPWRPTRIARATVLPDWDTLSIFETSRGSRRRRLRVRLYGDTVTPWEKKTPLLNWPLHLAIEEDSQGFHWRNEISRKLAESLTSQGIPTLLFVLHSRHQAFSIGNDFNAQIPDRPEPTQREKDLRTLAEYELGTVSLVSRLVDQKGVAVHTAIMLDCERAVSETAFKRGRARLLIATGTLSQGLNLIAKVVILCGTHLSEYGEEEIDPEELERLSLNQVLNATGRAARAQIACRGVSIIVPDNLIRETENLTPETPKSRFIDKLKVLGMEEASLSVDSSLKQLLKAVSEESDEAEVRDHDRLLLSRLPVNADSLELTVRNLLGTHELGSDEITESIIARLEAVKASAMRSGCEEWVLRAASLAGLDYSIAQKLKGYIESESSKGEFQPPGDSYADWAIFLIGWLKTLPSHATWEILRMHLRGWRYYWGTERDPDLRGELESNGYPDVANKDSLNLLEPIWSNMQDAVRSWIEGDSIVEVAETLTRREFPSAARRKRTNAGHCIPRAIMWSRGFIDRLSQFAGLLLALYEQWREYEPDTMPDWLSTSMALYTLPQGVRFGVRNPFALAWHRHAIQERRAANRLQEIVPLDTGEITNIREAQTYVTKAVRVFRDMNLDEQDSVVRALQRLIDVQ